MMKVSAFLGISLDGFIARKNGDIDWLDKANQKVHQDEDFGYSHFMESVDILIMGRNTYEQVLTFDKWPYKDKKVIVLSTKDVKIPVNLLNHVSPLKESPKNLVKQLSEKGVKHIYIDGGLTIQSFLQAGLIDEITITIVPVLIGEGKSLFGPLIHDISLLPIKTSTFDFGFVQIKYIVMKESI